MMLRTVRMRDFGLYAGLNVFDLAPRRGGGQSSPIVLVGGRNGAGKTTLLEAVRLALYGRRALGARVAQSDYDAHLLSRIHQGAPSGDALPAGPGSAAVELDFDYAEGGVVHAYRVRREWAPKGRGVVEVLDVEKDEKPLASVPREEWQQFLQELVPPGVSQLFFFDGEKIQEIADGEADNEQLAEAVRGLLGIETVSRLRSDVGLYLARHQRGGAGDLAGKLEKTMRERNTVQQRAGVLAEEVAELSTQRDSQARAAEQVRRRFVSEGGDEAARRAQTEAERDDVRRAIARVEHDMRDLANKLLPFAMAPKLVGAFKDALMRSGAGGERGRAAKELADAMLAWRGDGAPAREASWSAQHWADLQSFVGVWVGTGVAATSPTFRELGDGIAALDRLGEIDDVARPRALALRAELERLEKRLAAADRALARADTAAAGLLLDELSHAEQKVGATEATLHTRQEELQTARGQLVTLRRDHDRLLVDHAAGAASFERAGLAAKVAKALAAYENRLLAHKLGQLEKEFVGRFNHLARKKTLVTSVRIDPVTFATTLVDGAGREVPKARLSAGEKQIYAISMLWALARTSGRPLPMIIDTPLGRLDSEHRDNLVQRYFPVASHQVILLSTDTEVDGRLLKDLGSSVSHSYRLDYDPVAGRTTAMPGYFGTDCARREDSLALQQA